MDPTDADALVHAMRLWLGVGLLWLALWRGLQSVFIVEFRSDLFDIRRRLFMLVARRRIDPQYPVYWRMRGVLNGLLDRAETITPLNVIMMLVAASLYAPKYAPKVVRTTMA